MSIIVQPDTLDIYSQGNVIRAEERRKATGPLIRVIGILAGLAFLGGAWLFWSMEVDNADEIWWIRVILCGGLALIGLLLIWSNTAKKQKFDFVEIDGTAGEVRYGYLTKTEEVLKGQMSTASIRNIYVGGYTDDDAAIPQTGMGVLYIQGEGAPRKGMLLTGGRDELETVRDYILRLMR